MSGDWSAKTRAAAAERSGGICECCGTRRPVQLHHRLLREHGDHSLSNALHVCCECHTDIHLHPTRSYENGWLIRHTQDCSPARVLVLYRGQQVRLEPDGLISL